MTSDPALAARARSWLFDKNLPIWRTHGWDTKHGGFHERLSQDFKPIELGYKRLLVQCRQIYCYSHACIMGHRGFFERGDFSHHGSKSLRDRGRYFFWSHDSKRAVNLGREQSVWICGRLIHEIG